MLVERIVEWTDTQQPWLSDAARRLFVNGRIEPQEIDVILGFLKAAAGIDDLSDRVPEPLARAMIPAEMPEGNPIALVALCNLRGINAIASDQSLPFAESGLTVVYGNNGAGKSGYSRVLRKACRARATGGAILGDVFAVGAGRPSSAEIVIRRGKGAETETLVWRQGEPPPAELASVAVFDSLCARAFTDTEGEVAYTPRGLDVLAGLAALCVQLRERLDTEMNAIKASSTSFSDLLGDHVVGHLLAQFDKRFHLPQFRRDMNDLATVSEEEAQESDELAARMAEANPSARAAELRRFKGRVDGLASRWEKVEAALSDEKANAAIALGKASIAADAAAKLAADVFVAEGDLLPGTGSDPWRVLLDAARRFSGIAAYPGHDFPHVDSARCVLCQQELDASAADRMQRFERFVQQEAQKVADAARENAGAAFATVGQVDPEGLTNDRALADEIGQAKPGLAEVLANAGAALMTRKNQLAGSWAAKNFDAISPAPAPLAETLRRFSRGIEETASVFDKLAGAVARKQSEQRLKDLQSRQRLAGRLQQVNATADDLTLKSKLAVAHRAADSGLVSRKMQILHAAAVSVEAQAAFARECEALGVGHVPIRNFTRMERGRARQQVKLDTAGAEKVGDVLSEGEQRALAIATFMAEVSLVPGHGAVIFDDPMSSLDHARRERVARRLAQEASVRQVIVFTHDLAFANHLADAAAREHIEAHAMSVRRAGRRTGLVFAELPFAGAKVSERLERIRAMATEADAAAESGEPERSESIVRTGYGRLRETWERGVEESVLNETVVRFRPGVSTQRLRAVVISDEHYMEIHEAMARCSHFAAHDASLDAPAESPTADELRADVERARVFFAGRKKLNDETDRRRREMMERSPGLKQA
ncbi:hypothetical protein PTKU64_90470 (plasmid) [Paraburkholderia terrae]|uniref:Protein CR006 P-loop domain-containing protein n=1 Tax=Paraburkholderia terrae TaxID=311230 RepID=A0ABN6JWP7_9BURK|nr:AAA family ATPase [Paraburkholderia terrae]BCZ85372.1 hypothetical protein PTKU64_90470 [Paraburkholderia terrae]